MSSFPCIATESSISLLFLHIIRHSIDNAKHCFSQCDSSCLWCDKVSLKLFKIYLLVLMYMHLHSIATEFASNSNVSTCDLIALTTVQQSFHPSATSVVVSSSSPSKKFEHIALPVHELELNNFVLQTIKILVYKCDYQVQQYRQNHPLFVVSRR